MNTEKIGKLARSLLWKSGFDLVRLRSLNTTLTHHRINLVLDVGANAGQYGKLLREQGYRGRIVSFEPQKQPFGLLSAAAARDGHWTAVNIGLGSADEQKTINVYGDSTLSSLLTIDEQAPIHDSAQVGSEVIEVRTLDGIFDQYAAAGDRVLLKIDTQGFEKQVLAGAERSVARVTGIQIEMSLTPLYADQPKMDEMIALLLGKGFTLWQILRGFWVRQTGQEMEADGVFIRTELLKG